jgi:hypothetical protein
VVSQTRGFPFSSTGSRGAPGFSKILDSTFFVRVDGMLVGQSRGLEIDSGMVGITGWKSSGVSPDVCGSTANTAHVRHTLIASTQAMNRGYKDFK